MFISTVTFQGRGRDDFGRIGPNVFSFFRGGGGV